MHVGDTSNRVNPIDRSLSHPTTTSTTTSTNNVVNTTSRNQVNVNTVPAQQPILVPTDSWVHQEGGDVSNRFRNLHQSMPQNYQNTSHQSVELRNQASNHSHSVPGSNPNITQSRGEQNLLSSTMIEPPNRNPNEDSESDSDDPDMRGIFEDEEGNKDYKAYMIYWMAKYKERTKHKENSTTKAGHKINYGCVQPPTLHLEQELRFCTFEI